jgi:hypothetical protein
MPATFHPELDRAIDRLRLRVGDVDVEHSLMDDSTYTGAVDAYGENTAAAYLAASLIALFGQLPVRVDEEGKTLDFSERIRAWQVIIDQASGGTIVGVSSVGSFSVTLAQRYAPTTVDEYGRTTVTTRTGWWP